MATRAKSRAARGEKKAATRNEPVPRGPEAPKRAPAKPAPAVTRKDIRALQDAVAELRKQTGILEELVRGLRKQVKRLRKSEPTKRDHPAPESGASGDAAPPRPLARALGAIRRGVESTRNRVKRR